MKALAGKTAVVTGSSRGIGAAIAQRFAEEGAAVVLVGRDFSTLESVRQKIEAVGGRAWSGVADVTNLGDMVALRDRIERKIGPADIVVANAGGNPTMPCPIEELSEGEWRSVLDGNLTATFLTVKCFLPGMKDRRSGNIITISSAAARRPSAKSPAAYAAAKAGVELLTQDLALQAGPYNIRANCIAPETILTERNRERISEQKQIDLASLHPLQRLGRPDDIASAALFLASEASSWISGVVVDVAGGSVTV